MHAGAAAATLSGRAAPFWGLSVPISHGSSQAKPFRDHGPPVTSLAIPTPGLLPRELQAPDSREAVMRNMCGAACPRAEGDRVQTGPGGEGRRREASTVARLCRCPRDLGRQDLGPVCFSGVVPGTQLEVEPETGTDWHRFRAV